jgi:hypothetical protein
MPGPAVVSTAMIKCSMSALPGPPPNVPGGPPIPLAAVPKGPPVIVAGRPVATIMDYAPLINIATFGQCISPTNPAVVTATGLAGGTPTAVPCIPAIVTPWTPGGPTVLINGAPVLNPTSVCQCTLGGTIAVTMPGQTTVIVP